MSALPAFFWSRPVGANGPTVLIHLFSGVWSRPICGRRFVAAGPVHQDEAQRCTICEWMARNRRTEPPTERERKRIRHQRARHKEAARAK